jgi:ArsR family transcriptional regulator
MNKFSIIRLLADENRFNIFMQIMDYDSLCVSELESLLGLKQANVSKHLKRLKEAEVLESNRQKNKIYYSICPVFLEEHMDLIKYLIT